MNLKRQKPCEVLVVALGSSLVCLTHSMVLGAEPQWTATNSMTEVGTQLERPKSGIWQNGAGEGFQPSVQDFSVEPGIALGIAAFGSQQAHNLGLLSLSYGHMLGQVKGEGHWYRGNIEWRLELFGGMQFHPDIDTDGWLIGLTPHVRYNFATGTRWIPFFDLGAGVTATGIGPPDLSGTFEFNLQATTGLSWFLRDNLALTGDVRYMHFSCAGIHHPNLGMNDVGFFLGVTWFFGK